MPLNPTDERCVSFRDAASQLSAEELRTLQTFMLDTHSANCGDCREFLREMRSTTHLLQCLLLREATREAEAEALECFRRHLGSERPTVGLATLQHGRELWRSLSNRPQGKVVAIQRMPEVDRRALCAWLFSNAEEAVTTEPRRGLQLAEDAVRVCRSLHETSLVGDLLARCYWILSVARLAVSDIDGSRMALKQAKTEYAESSGSLRTQARILSAEAWIESARGFEERAETLLQRAELIYAQLGEVQTRIKARVTLSSVYLRSGRTREAIQLLKEVISQIDDEAEPRVAWGANLNLGIAYCEERRFCDAEEVLATLKQLVDEIEGDAPIHLRWLEGSIAQARGDWPKALRVFRWVRGVFAQREEALHFIESSLDICRVYLRVGDLGSLQQMAGETARAARAMSQDASIRDALALLEQGAEEMTLGEVQIRAIVALLSWRSTRGEQR